MWSATPFVFKSVHFGPSTLKCKGLQHLEKSPFSRFENSGVVRTPGVTVAKAMHFKKRKRTSVSSITHIWAKKIWFRLNMSIQCDWCWMTQKYSKWFVIYSFGIWTIKESTKPLNNNKMTDHNSMILWTVCPIDSLLHLDSWWYLAIIYCGLFYKGHILCVELQSEVRL